jgi:hypothetical protein
MKEPLQSRPTGESEETLVTPRFDEVETVQAQPVVPLAEVPPPGVGGVRGFAGRRFASWPLALVLVSALVGVVVGGAGLYFYQHRPTENASADSPQAAPSPAEAPQVTPPAEESASLPPQQAEPPNGEADAAEVVSSEIVEPPAEGADDAKKEEAAKSPAPEPRRAAEPGDDSGGRNRGRNAEREAEAPRSAPRAARVGSREGARDDDDDGREPEARLSDEIIYPRDRRAARRAERRARRENRQRSVDRVRGIFEGQPE